jgi:HAD superfamily hydrolase (TIGR01484 family)
LNPCDILLTITARFDAKGSDHAMTTRMRPIAEIPAETCRQLRGVFCDIDDTLTTDGKLLACSYSALWKARAAGLAVVPVTGRPAGWVDHFARMWPVDAVIGENGAFIFWLENGKLQRRFVQSAAERASHRRELETIREQVLREIPRVKVATDQAYRESDLAIDFAEEVQIDDASVPERIVAIFERHGARAKISSIHVNGWFGDFDKLTAAKTLIDEIWREQAASIDRYLYVGDSPNDEPLFAGFFQSAGVANIRRFQKRLTHLPRYVAERDGGEGFAEIIDTILARRA